jgi:hypothetical protein
VRGINARNIMLIVAAGAAASIANAQTSVDAGGWRITTFSPNVAVEVNFVDGGLFITKRATVVGTIEGGIPAPIVVNFQQIAPDALTESNIVIVQEVISNQSGVDWDLYRQELAGSAFVAWDPANSAGWNPAPFTSNNYWSNNGLTLNVVDHSGGVVPNNTVWNPSQNLAIAANIGQANFPVVFSLKEIPLPTPGAIALAGLAGLAVARRRR